MQQSLEAAGFFLKVGAIGDAALNRLLASCDASRGGAELHHRSGATYGIRGLLWSSSTLRSELDAAGASACASEALGRPAFPIDAIFFDKQPCANWSVPGHQDRLMPIASGSGSPRSVRHGIAYAELRQETLAKLVAVRIHFDHAEFEAGALQVVPGSHRRGVLAGNAIRDVALAEYHSCVASRGDLLIMRPLLLHRSGPLRGAGHRRVLHVVYACEEPGDGSRWKSPA